MKEKDEPLLVSLVSYGQDLIAKYSKLAYTLRWAVSQYENTELSFLESTIKPWKHFVRLPSPAPQAFFAKKLYTEFDQWYLRHNQLSSVSAVPLGRTVIDDSDDDDEVANFSTRAFTQGDGVHTSFQSPIQLPENYWVTHSEWSVICHDSC